MYKYFSNYRWSLLSKYEHFYKYLISHCLKLWCAKYYFKWIKLPGTFTYSQRNCMGSPCICDMLPYDWKGETPIIPQTINVGPYNIKVYQCIPNPTRCFQYQTFGHGKQACRVWFGFMVFYATFNNNISVVSSRSVLLLEETRVPGENYPPAASHWQTNRQYNIIKKVEHYIPTSMLNVIKKWNC